MFQLAEELVAAHPVEARVGDDHEEVLLLEQPQRLLGGVHRPDFIALVRHDGFQGKPHVLLVIDNQQRWQFDTHSFAQFHGRLGGKL